MDRNIYKKEKLLSFGIGVFIQSFFIALAVTMVASVLLNYRYFNVVSSSMSPYMPVGTVIIVAPTPIEAIEAGDVATYRTVNGLYVTHRVVGFTYINGERYILTAPEVYWQDEAYGNIGTVEADEIPDWVDGSPTPRSEEYIVGTVIAHFVGLGSFLNQFNIILIIIGSVLILFVLNFA